jgi:hypothetical protein
LEGTNEDLREQIAALTKETSGSPKPRQVDLLRLEQYRTSNKELEEKNESLTKELDKTLRRVREYAGSLADSLDTLTVETVDGHIPPQRFPRDPEDPLETLERLSSLIPERIILPIQARFSELLMTKSNLSSQLTDLEH